MSARHLCAPLLLVLGAAPVGAQDMAHHHAPAGTDAAAGAAPAAETFGPPAPADHAADAVWDPAAMARARRALTAEAGGMTQSMLLVDQLEWQPARGADAYRWEAKGWWGGDIDRVALETRGEGETGAPLDQGEVEVGWLHAIDPWFNVRAGVRQDFGKGPARTHAALTIEGLAPYWFDVEASLFVSNKGEVSARAEASYDQRLTQRLILQPRAELNAAASAVPARGLGSGPTSAELGLRLRYEIVREFAPYAGLAWERKLGGTARLARAAGEDSGGLRAVAGVRFWF